MAFTKSYMQATMPQLSALSSIGSAAANWERDDSSSEEHGREAARFLFATDEARLVLGQFGQPDFDALLDELAEARQTDKDHEWRSSSLGRKWRMMVERVRNRMAGWRHP